ncbi:MAG TPA: hypothetical protein VIH57_09580 [Bacteroidales bacterium]
MTIKQISVFLENKSGRLAEVLGSLGQRNIRISALTIADTSEYGILRLIVNDFQGAVETLKEKGFTVNVTDVIAISTPSQAGSFAKVLEALAEENISVEYMYAFKLGANASIILRPEFIDQALNVLQKHKFALLNLNDLANL